MASSLNYFRKNIYKIWLIPWSSRVHSVPISHTVFKKRGIISTIKWPHLLHIPHQSLFRVSSLKAYTLHRTSIVLHPVRIDKIHNGESEELFFSSLIWSVPFLKKFFLNLLELSRTTTLPHVVICGDGDVWSFFKNNYEETLKKNPWCYTCTHCNPLKRPKKNELVS